MATRALGWGPRKIDGIDVLQRNGLFETGTPVEADSETRFTKVVGFWVPRRWVTPAAMDVDGMVAELQEIVRTRGLISYDGQVITNLRRTGPWEACFEAVSIDTPVDIPERRSWGAEQRTFFGVENPYQMADDEDWFTCSSVSTSIADPYLAPDELIAGVVHGAKERCCFTCPCHYADVVYTTRHRLVCMSCGATHVVLMEPMLTSFSQTVAPEEWDELFGPEGSRHHEPLDLKIVDVQDIEAAAAHIWSTRQWDEALSDFIFRARSTPEEYEAAIRGTECDASIFLEAGWRPVREPPAPAFQIVDGSVDIDMLDNAAFALKAGSSGYLESYVRPERLVNAVKDLFQAVELLLKVRVEASNPLALRDEPNNPTVLTRLAAVGVTLTDDETETLTDLRRLRNDLQHKSARFNHRITLGLCRRALILIDRFVIEELNIWAGDVIAPDDWHKLLRIDEIHARAVAVAHGRLQDYDSEAEASVTTCARCSHETMLRPHPNTGAACVLCGHIPVVTE